jgi:hypothetical protein
MVLADARVLRLEYTWSRRPRRKSGSLPTLKNGRLGATAPSAADLNACLQIEVMTATRSALGWSSKALSRSSQLGAITPSLRIRTEASSGDTSADGLLSVGNAWLQTFRRWVVRYERSATIFTALIYLACALTTLKRVLG